MTIHNKYTPSQELQICTLYDEGKNPTEIGKILKTYNTTIRRILLRNNYVLKGPSETQRVVKTNPFKDLSNKEVQYWIGFISADGNISTPTYSKYTIDVSADEKDVQHLCKYSKFIGYDVQPKSYKNKKYGSYMCSVRFGNKEIHQFLNKIGITPNKSKTLHLNIPLTSHIVRGVLDGDGCVKCVGDKRVSVEIATGSELFFNQLKTYLKQFLKVTGTFSNGLGLVRVCTQSEIVKFYDLLYGEM